MSTNSDKTASPCRAYFLPISECETSNFPGQKTISVTGYWLQLPARNISFKEDDPANGEPIEQNFQCFLRGLSSDNEAIVEKITTVPCLIRIDYTNEVSKVVGTEDEPVIVQSSSGETPYSHTLSFKRNSAEKAKTLR